MTNVSRREFLTAGGISAAFLGLGYAGGLSLPGKATPERGFGPLVKDPKGLLDLPAGFSYVVFSRQGDEMDDGLVVPGHHDGMAAFPGPGGTTIVVRNHELVTGLGPWGENDRRLRPEHEQQMYELGAIGDGSGPTVRAPGGTTTFVFDTTRQELKRQWLSLAGTLRNCAGGLTPWGSWLSCEECVFDKGGFGFEQDHGYVFEVPAEATPRLVKATPIKPLGRMNHEACAVDPTTGFVYQTEDEGDSLFYRFLPNKPGELQAGGRLQALVILGRPRASTSNHLILGGIGVGASLPVGWVDLDVGDPNALRKQGYAKGAATFSRGEGLWWGDGGAVFTCTSGGPTHAGQVWRYEPVPDEDLNQPGTPAGTLRLVVQPGRALFENVDNICVTPWGDLFACEDGPAPNRVVGITPKGEVYHLAAHRASSSELTGACFSPDGTTLFVNVQKPGLTLAVTGPWWHRARDSSGA